MDACVGWQWHLCVVECKGHVGLLSAELSEVASNFNKIRVAEVLICINFTEMSFTNVCVAELSHFIPGLESVTEGEVTIIHVVRVANRKGPARGGRPWNRLIDTLDPPLEHLASIQRARESKGRSNEGVC